MAYRSFEELEVWQRACQQAVAIYTEFENCRRPSLRDQAERASLSVPSNIAEGSERNSSPDFKRFLNIALGSNGELRTQLYIARRLDLVSTDRFQILLAESKEISAMIRGLHRSLG